MTEKHFEKWLGKLKKVWLEKDPGAASELFSENVSYFETPFVKSIGRGEVVKAWNEVLRHEKIVLTTDILSWQKNVGIAHWNASFFADKKRFEYDGIYFCEFDSKGLCSKFKQWSVKKDLA